MGTLNPLGGVDGVAMAGGLGTAACPEFVAWILGLTYARFLRTWDPAIVFAFGIPSWTSRLGGH